MILKSTKFNKFPKATSKILWLFFGVLVFQSIYLIFSQLNYKIGFPLDDSWIHQTYARNYFQSGVWSFNTNTPSGGSTAPLWSFLLIPGYFLSGSFYLYYSHFLGGLFLFGSAVIFEKIITKSTQIDFSFPVFGYMFLLEWHFLWAANSGMETILFVFLISFFFYLLNQQTYDFRMGLILALIIWVRPDGITLLGPIIFTLFFIKKSFPIKKFLLIFLPLIVSIIFYLLFNFKLSGSVFPNTFYAKQSEYAILYQQSIFLRFFQMIKTQIIGVGILLLPGLFYSFIQKCKYFDSSWLATFFWWLGYLLIYAIRLPVTYQHGRYQIPALAVFFILSIPGCIHLLGKMKQNYFPILRKAWLFSGFLILIIFYFLGAEGYATDVAIIETEMVNTAKWIYENTDPSAKIAAHDIGALGYFGKREVVDLAGLISPEVIPFIGDEEKLIQFLNLENVDYVMTFETWYTKIPELGVLVYQSQSKFSKNQGGDVMQVFIWND